MGADEGEQRDRMEQRETDVEREDLRAEQHAPGARQHRPRQDADVGPSPSPP